MSAPRPHPFVRLILCAIVIFFLLSVVQTVGLLALLPFSKQLGVAGMPIAGRLTAFGEKYGLYLMAVSYPVLLGAIYFVRTHIDKYSWRSLGFSRTRVAPDLALGSLTALLTLSVLFALMWLIGAIHFGGMTSDVQTHNWLYSVVQLLGFGIAFCGTGIFEETLFRGYTLANARQWLGWKGAVALQAVVFASIHLTNGIGKPEVMKAAFMAMPNIALIAVFFALSYRKTGSLWFPIGFHIRWNWLLGCVFSLPVSGIPTFRLFDIQAVGNPLINGGQFGAEASVLLIPLIGAMCYFISLSPDHPQAVANLDAPEPSHLVVPASAPLASPFQPAYATTPSAVAPNLSLPLTPTPEAQSMEEDEEPRENRFKARFGSAEGFDSGMLSELKQMQHAREEAERRRVESERAARRAEEAQKEALRRAQMATQELQTPHEVQPVAIVETTTPALEAPTPQSTLVVAKPESEVAAPPISLPARAVAPTPTTPLPSPLPSHIEVATESIVPIPSIVSPRVNPTPITPVVPVVPVAPPAPQPVPPANVAPADETQTPVPQAPKARPRW